MVGRSHVIANVASAGALASGVHSMCRSEGLMAELGMRLFRFFVPVQSNMPLLCLYLIGGALLYLLGSLLPDIDSKMSTLGRYIYLPVRHRTLTHSIWVVALLFLLSWKIRIFAWLALGYMLHIFWDGLSSAGIAWFWPLSRYIYYPSGAVIKKGFRFKFYKTGEASETVLVIGICILSVACIVMTILASIRG